MIRLILACPRAKFAMASFHAIVGTMSVSHYCMDSDDVFGAENLLGDMRTRKPPQSQMIRRWNSWSLRLRASLRWVLIRCIRYGLRRRYIHDVKDDIWVLAVERTRVATDHDADCIHVLVAQLFLVLHEKVANRRTYRRALEGSACVNLQHRVRQTYPEVLHLRLIQHRTAVQDMAHTYLCLDLSLLALQLPPFACFVPSVRCMH